MSLRNADELPQEQEAIQISADLFTIYRAEGAAVAATTARLIAIDLGRFRRLAEAAIPVLTEQQWGLIAATCDMVELVDLMNGSNELPSGKRVASEIAEWANERGSCPEWARDLYEQMLQWPPLTIAGVLMRLRADLAKGHDEAFRSGS